MTPVSGILRDEDDRGAGFIRSASRPLTRLEPNLSILPRQTMAASRTSQDGYRRYEALLSSKGRYLLTFRVRNSPSGVYSNESRCDHFS